MTDQLHITTEQAGDATILRPEGDIDLSRAPALRYHIAEVQRTEPPRLIIDLSGVPYMDSSGVATLVEAMQVSRRQRGQLVLCCLQEKVRSIFEIARLDMVFPIAGTTEEALRL